MQSIRELYRTGTGPSSSHTMAPRRAAEIFLREQPDAAAYRVTLYGSLASTGATLLMLASSDSATCIEFEIAWRTPRPSRIGDSSISGASLPTSRS